MALSSINPATGEKLKEFPAFNDNEIEKRLKRAERAFAQYRRHPFANRGQLLMAVASLLEQDKDSLARTMTMEMGKLFRAAKNEIVKCARACRFYAENGERFLEDEAAQTDAARSYVRYEALGPVLAIMPWNFPFWQVFRFAVPALMAGNVGLLKHAANVPQCALAIEEVFCRAGFDEGIFQVLLIEAEQVEKIIVDPRVKAVTLTGSEKAGSAVASTAARHIKKSVLELGGSDPFIVMPSADFDSALRTAIKARTTNSGQSCIAAKRFLVADDIYDEFLQRFVEGMRTLKSAISDETTEIGLWRRNNSAGRARASSEIGRAAQIIDWRKSHSRFRIFLRTNCPGQFTDRLSRLYRRGFGPVASFFAVRCSRCSGDAAPRLHCRA
jgi:succinate-semialdehyde dehydrogenase/glutarate-semialdehyde dehydrogenase